MFKSDELVRIRSVFTASGTSGPRSALVYHNLCIADAPRPIAYGMQDAVRDESEPAFPHEPDDARAGRMLFEMFRTVVLLKEQVRVVDPVWLDFLRHLRQGTVREEHVHMLKGLILTDFDCPVTDFTAPPWDSASLVTPRHAVREAWNDAALLKHCQKQKKQVFVCPAEDMIQGRSLSPQEKLATSLQCRRRKKER